MSDRLAVFNQGRIEQVGAPAEVYERPGDPVRGRLRRHLEPADRRRRRGHHRDDGHVHHPAGEDPPGRAGRHGRRRRAVGASGTIRDVVYLGPDTRYIVELDAGARLVVTATEPGDDLERGARPARQGCPPHLEATARTPRRGRGGRNGGGGDERMRNRRIVGLLAAGALVAAACTSGSGGSPAPSAQAELGAGEGALNLIIWAGYAERGAIVPGIRLGHAVRGEDRLHRQDDGHDRLEQRRVAHAVRRLRRRFVLGQRDDAADGRRDRRAGQHGADPELRQHLRGAQDASPTTRWTACPTACRTDAGPNLLMYNTEAITPAPTTWDRVWSGGRTATRSASTTRRTTSPTRRCT